MDLDRSRYYNTTGRRPYSGTEWGYNTYFGPKMVEKYVFWSSFKGDLRAESSILRPIIVVLERHGLKWLKIGHFGSTRFKWFLRWPYWEDFA